MTARIVHPEALRITAADWALGEGFVRPAPDSPANRAIRKRLAPLLLFASIPLPRLEFDSPSSAPWSVISTLAGYLGPCLTNASRVASTSAVQFASNKVWSHFKDGGSPASLAFTFRDEFHALKLPSILHSDSLTEASLLSDLSDSLSYKSTETAKASILEKRIFLIGRRFASPTQSMFTPAPSHCG